MVSILKRLKIAVAENEVVIKKNYDDFIDFVKTDLPKDLLQFAEENLLFFLKNVALFHLKSENVEIVQRSLYFLGFLLSLPNVSSVIDKQNTLTVLDEICNVSGVFLSKVLAQRCLWCLSTQNLPEKHVDQRYSEIFQFIEQIINSTETNSPLVRLEIISVLQKFYSLNGEKFFANKNVWIPILIKFCVDQSGKVRVKALRLLESCLRLTQDKILLKDALKNVMPDFVALVSTEASFAIHFWKWLVNLFGEGLLKSSSFLNILMPPIETAFKSEDQTVKCLGFEAWRSLIEILSSNIENITDSKRLNLFMQPLLVGSRTSERLAMEKVKTWIVLMKALDSELEKFFDVVCAPLLRFCVGGECEIVRKSVAECLSPQLNKSFRTPVSPQTPKLYLINAEKSVGPMKLPCFPSIQFFLGELLLDFLCGPVELKNFKRVLNFAPKESCITLAITVEKQFSLFAQCLRIWAASASKNDEVVVRCWENLGEKILKSKPDLLSSNFDAMVNSFLTQLSQFRKDNNVDSDLQNVLIQTKKKLLRIKNSDDVSSTTSDSSFRRSKAKFSTEIDELTNTVFDTTEMVIIDDDELKNRNLVTPTTTGNNSTDFSKSEGVLSKKSRKKLKLDASPSDDDVIYIPTPMEKKSPMVLTERQKEKFSEQKEMPYLDRANSQSVDNRINPEMFVTESQAIEHEFPPEISSNNKNQVEIPTENQTSPTKKHRNSFKKLKKLITPTVAVIVDKLTNHEIEILTQEKLSYEDIEKRAETDDFEKRQELSKKKMPKSKSETDLPCVRKEANDIVLSSQPTISWKRSKSVVLTTPKKSNEPFSILSTSPILSGAATFVPDSCRLEEEEEVQAPVLNKEQDNNLIENWSPRFQICRVGSFEKENSGEKSKSMDEILCTPTHTVFPPYTSRSNSFTRIRPFPGDISDVGDSLHEDSSTVISPGSFETSENQNNNTIVQEDVPVEEISEENRAIDSDKEILKENSQENIIDKTFEEAVDESIKENNNEIQQTSSPKSSGNLNESYDEEAIRSKSRAISPCSTPSASGILKRKRARDEFNDNRNAISQQSPVSSGKRQVHFAPELMINSDDEQDQVKTSPCKRARLQFSPPIFYEPLYFKKENLFVSRFSARTHDMIRRINNQQKGRSDDNSLESTFVSTNENVSLTKEINLNNSQPIFSSLIDDQTDVSQIIPSLVASAWIDSLLQELKSKNITTVGGLARLTELDVHHLQIKQPKGETLKNALLLFENKRTTAVLDNLDLNISGVVPMEDDKSVEGESSLIVLENPNERDAELADLNDKLDTGNVSDRPPSNGSSKSTIPSGQPPESFLMMPNFIERSNSEMQTDTVTINSAVDLLETSINREGLSNLSKDDKFALFTRLQRIVSDLFTCNL